MNRNVHIYKIAALAVMLLASSISKAYALYEYFSPYGNATAVWMMVGEQSDGTLRLIYSTQLSGTRTVCSSFRIGVNGRLFGTTLIHGTSKADELFVPQNYSWNVCGFTLENPGTMSGKITFQTHGGSDTAFGNNNTNAKYDLGEVGGDNQPDRGYVINAERMVGSGGGDTLIAFGSDTIDVYGLGGDDKFCGDFIDGGWHIMDGGGNGFDFDMSYGTATYVNNIESPQGLTSAWCEGQKQSIFYTVTD